MDSTGIVETLRYSRQVAPGLNRPKPAHQSAQRVLLYRLRNLLAHRRLALARRQLSQRQAQLAHLRLRLARALLIVNEYPFHSRGHHNFRFNYIPFYLDSKVNRESLWIVDNHSFHFRGHHNFRFNHSFSFIGAIDIWNSAIVIGTKLNLNIAKPELFHRITAKICCYHHTEYHINDSRLQHIKFSVNERSSAKLTDNGASSKVDINTSGKLKLADKRGNNWFEDASDFSLVCPGLVIWHGFHHELNNLDPADPVDAAGKSYLKQALTVAVSSPDQNINTSSIGAVSLTLDQTSIVQTILGLCKNYPSASSTPGLTTGIELVCCGYNWVIGAAIQSQLGSHDNQPNIASTGQTSSPQGSSTSPAPSTIGSSIGTTATSLGGSTVTVVSSTSPASTVLPNGSSTPPSTSLLYCIHGTKYVPVFRVLNSYSSYCNLGINSGTSAPTEGTGSTLTAGSTPNPTQNTTQNTATANSASTSSGPIGSTGTSVARSSSTTHIATSEQTAASSNTEPGASSSTTTEWTPTSGPGNSTSSGTTATSASTGSNGWTTSSEPSTASSSGPQRTKCTALFYIDASTAAVALNVTESEKNFILNIGETLYPDTTIELHVALAAYGDDDFDQKPDVDTTDRDIKGLTVDLAHAIAYLNKISEKLANVVVVLFTASNQDIIDGATGSNSHAAWTIGLALSGQNLTGIAVESAVLTMKDQTASMLKTMCLSGITTTAASGTGSAYIGEALYPDGSIELIAALAAYGDDDFDQKPDVDTTDVDLVNLTADLDQYRFEAPNDDNVKNAIRYLNQIEAKLNNIVVVLMTASNQDIIDSASGSNQHASWTIGLALSGQNLTGIAVESADLTMKDQTASLLKTMCLNAATPISALGMGST
ncbi:unnamed protein product, partial [Mesorhabditis spiculigera]